MADHVPADLRGKIAGFAVLHAALVIFVDLSGALREDLYARFAEVGYTQPQYFPDLFRCGGLRCSKARLITLRCRLKSICWSSERSS